MLKDKIIFVTGGGRGMGRGIAQALSEAGADVGIGDLDLAQVRETGRLVEGAGCRALEVALDVTQPASIAAAIKQMVDRFGRIDGWVNNAGVIKMAPALDLSLQEWDRHFQVNTSALFACCQLAAEQMIAQGAGGSIVNIASNAGKVGYGNMAAYNASKAAVINLTRSLSSEWAQYKINVNAVCPGGVDTPMLLGVAEWVASRVGGDPRELVKGMKPHQMDRHVQPIEVGRVVAFLLSDDAQIIRGQSINVDAGDTPY
jgi:NAD(P)-dependent dehydrogenase (short-subunit alcohol dehydrogenase family)